MATRPAALLIVLCAACAPRGTPTPAAGETGRVTTNTVPYTCAGGQAITTTYLAADSGAVTFVVLRWNGQTYGLAPAVSASGARYAGLFGSTVSDRGLEWWEAKGEATLSTFTGQDFTSTRPLLTACRPQR